MTRKEHVDWCKKRALEYLDAGDRTTAIASMLSDLRKHEETASHPGKTLLVMYLAAGHLSTEWELRKFIEDFR